MSTSDNVLMQSRHHIDLFAHTTVMLLTKGDNSCAICALDTIKDKALLYTVLMSRHYSSDAHKFGLRG